MVGAKCCQVREIDNVMDYLAILTNAASEGLRKAAIYMGNLKFGFLDLHQLRAAIELDLALPSEVQGSC